MICIQHGNHVLMFYYRPHLKDPHTANEGRYPHPAKEGYPIEKNRRYSHLENSGVPPSDQWGYLGQDESSPHQDWMGYPPLPLHQLDGGTPPPPVRTRVGGPPHETEKHSERLLCGGGGGPCLLRSRSRIFLGFFWNNIQCTNSDNKECIQCKASITLRDNTNHGQPSLFYLAGGSLDHLNLKTNQPPTMKRLTDVPQFMDHLIPDLCLKDYGPPGTSYHLFL